MIVGITGLKGSGKTTVAKFIQQEYGLPLKNFADPLKEAAKKIFLLDDDQLHDQYKKEKVDPDWGMSPREMLQQLGTDVARQIDEDVWVKNMKKRLRNADGAVIGDVRFVNEAKLIKEMGGKILGIDRPGCVPDNHKSEMEMFARWDEIVDVTISNSSDKTALYALVEKVITEEFS